MKIHVLANPRNPTGLMNRVDPFAVHAYKYIKHLSPHFEMIHYGVPGAQVDCEHVDIHTTPIEIRLFNERAGAHIRQRASDGDIIVCFYGVDNKLACEMNPNCKPVEPSIGYRANGVFANYRAFTSYAQMHYFYGERGMLMNPSWFDAVIGNPFTVSEFEYNDKKEDYYLYFGRVCEEKGVHLAIQATEKLGKKLIVAGPGSLKSLGYDSDVMTAHGFRTTASTLLNEQGWSPDAIERQLAHTSNNKVRDAYNRAQYLDERRRMMQSWSDYLDSLKNGAQIIPIKHNVI